MLDLLNQFGDDPTIRILAGLVALDFIIGVCAAVKMGVFRLSYIADMLRNDVLGKLVPLCGLWIVLHLVGDVDLGGLDVIEESSSGVAIAALLGSILNSLRDLGLGTNTPDTIAGPDPAAPGPSA